MWEGRIGWATDSEGHLDLNLGRGRDEWFAEVKLNEEFDVHFEVKKA